MYKLLTLVLALLLSACITNTGGYRNKKEVEAQLMAMSAEQVYQCLGKPRQVTDLFSEHEKWKYFEEPDGLSGGDCVIEIFVAHNQVRQATVISDGKSELFLPMKPCRNFINTIPAKPEPE